MFVRFSPEVTALEVDSADCFCGDFRGGVGCGWQTDVANIIGKSGNFERKTPMEKPITAQTFEYPQKERFGAGGKLGFGMGQMKFTRDQVKLPLCCLDQILETLYNFFLSHCCSISRFDEILSHCQPLWKRSFSCYVQVFVLKMMAWSLEVIQHSSFELPAFDIQESFGTLIASSGQLAKTTVTNDNAEDLP